VLGAAVCATFVYAAGPGHDPDDQLADPGVIDRNQRALTADEQPAMKLLQRAAQASREILYSGIKVLNGAGPGVFVDIWHVPGQGTTSKVEEGTLDPGSPDAQLIDDQSDDGMDDLVLATLTHGYGLAVMGLDECNDRPTTVVEVHALDDHRLAAKLWLDDETGLLLRRQLYDSNGHPARSMAYVDFKVGAAAVRGPADSGPPVPDGGTTPGRKAPTPSASPAMQLPASTPLTDLQVAQLRAKGWPLPDVLPSGWQRYRAYQLDNGAIQLSFSDGLFSSSLFVQHGQLDSHTPRGFHPEKLGDANVYVSSGLYRTLVWAGGDTVYTLISEAPASVADSAVTALPHRAPDTSVLGRIGRGIARVASWINPFD
jgi:sigma-E factor negative regulatory protein RseB